MRALVLALAGALAASFPVAAQEMHHHHHEGAAGPAPAASPGEAPVGDAPAPPVPLDHAADRVFGPEEMARARRNLMQEGRFATAAIMIDRLEVLAGKGAEGYAWEAEAWYGGDIDRAVLASEGEGDRSSAERVEVRALWRHAIDPWFNLELGLRHDFRPGPERTYAVIGAEGIAPYWIEIEGQVFVSDRGDVHARAEASFDQRITQRLILQPRGEIDLAFQDVPDLGVRSGIDRIELGVRLRYEIGREFAPYLGLQWERQRRMAGYAGADRDGPSGLRLALGLRSWF